MNSQENIKHPFNQSRFERKRFRRRMQAERPWGILLVIAGILLLCKTANLVILPVWLFTWPVILIALGLLTGFRHRFRGGFWLALLIIGAFGLADRIDPTLHLARFNWPVVLIAVGLMFIVRPRRRRWSRWQQGGEEGTERDLMPYEHTDASDYVEVTSVFGGIKKNVLSKNFKGGDILCVMGGAEIDLTQADFNGKIHIDATMAFGGTKLIVPSSWDVQSEITAVFGGVDDKRQIVGVNLDPNKVLVLEGSCFFGGLEIRSF